MPNPDSSQTVKAPPRGLRTDNYGLPLDPRDRPQYKQYLAITSPAR